MNIKIKNVRDEKSFSKIANLYKKAFPVGRIATNKFHKYAFIDGIYFKSFYDNEKLIGFAKGFFDGKNLYISWLALSAKRYFEIIVKKILSAKTQCNVIFAIRSLDEIPEYEKLGFKAPNLGYFLAGKGLFVCSRPELFNDKEIVDGIRKYDWPLMFGNGIKTSIYYSKVNNINVAKYMPLLPKTRQEKANNFKFEKDKKLSIGVYILLKKALKLHHINIEDYEFKYEENGKPYLENCPLQFSISHSGDYVAVAISKAPIGVDIQEMREIDPKINHLVFHERDEHFYDLAKDKRYAFYKIWTYKEAYIKMTGEGLLKPLKEISINYLFDYNMVFYYNYLIDENYQLSVCAKTFGVKTLKEIKI